MLPRTGVGNPLSPERTRMLLALRINVLAKGYSGISPETLHAMIQAFNGQPSASLYANRPGRSASVDRWSLVFFGISIGEADCRMTRLPLTLTLSFLPLLCPREGNGWCEWRPGASFSPGPGADGRGENVVSQERVGRCKICKILQI